MNFLRTEKLTIDRFLPCLQEQLGSKSFSEMEKANSPAISIFKLYNGPRLVVPKDYGGSGASLLDAIRIQRIIGSICPSLAVAVTMHAFTVATFSVMSDNRPSIKSLLSNIAKNNLYVSSGFAEGNPNHNVLQSSIISERVKGGFSLSGSKKPCSLSKSMDFLTASFIVSNEHNKEKSLALSIVPSDTSGIRRKPFWNSHILIGAESDEIILENVFVPDSNVFTFDNSQNLDVVQSIGFVWFELLISASYLGIASGLIKKVIEESAGNVYERASLVVRAESAMASLEGIAYSFMTEKLSETQIVKSFMVRYSTQKIIEECSMLSAELLGGMRFINSSDIAYTLAASRALAFHPPSRINLLPAIDSYLRTGNFSM